MEQKSKSNSNRLAFIDFTRGLGAVIMLQGHVFHSFMHKDLRNSSPYILSQFIGGMPPAIFLFLTGVTLAFLFDSKERKGATPKERWLSGLNRAGYLFMLAVLFRVQLWAFAFGQSPIQDLFRVDILNSMGFGIAVISTMAVFTLAERARLCLVLGAAIAMASPLVSQLDWTGVHPYLRGYIAPDPNTFSFFPWAAFLAFGVAAGSIIRMTGTAQLKTTLTWAALAGIALILGGQSVANIPYSIYPKADFWLDSPALIMIKMGIILLMMSFAWLWMQTHTENSYSWVAQLGTTSLLVYWVHIELVYGRWLGFMKDALTVPQTVLVSAVVIAMMVGLSYMRTNWRNIEWMRRLHTQFMPAAEPEG